MAHGSAHGLDSCTYNTEDPFLRQEYQSSQCQKKCYFVPLLESKNFSQGKKKTTFTKANAFIITVWKTWVQMTILGNKSQVQPFWTPLLIVAPHGWPFKQIYVIWLLCFHPSLFGKMVRKKWFGPVIESLKYGLGLEIALHPTKCHKLVRPLW